MLNLQLEISTIIEYIDIKDRDTSLGVYLHSYSWDLIIKYENSFTIYYDSVFEVF